MVESSSRLQSAMEYLMTYGWAILIIAVVLGALFGLGFFNSANLAPKVTAGSCQVYRPNGPGTTSFINLEGTCNNELPQYVAQFNGASSYISTGTTGLPAGNPPVSVFAWVYFTGSASSGAYTIYSYGDTGVSGALVLYCIDNGNINWAEYACGGPLTGTAVSPNTWHLVGMTMTPNGGATSIKLYVDGSLVASGSEGAPTVTPITYSYIGYDTTHGNHFQGSIADVQVYNSTLSANEITALYQEGVGGVPIVLRNLTGWWPLNGNANDYSGNLNNGAPTNVVYTGSWTSGYTAP